MHAIIGFHSHFFFTFYPSTLVRSTDVSTIILSTTRLPVLTYVAVAVLSSDDVEAGNILFNIFIHNLLIQLLLYWYTVHYSSTRSRASEEPGKLNHNFYLVLGLLRVLETIEVIIL